MKRRQFVRHTAALAAMPLIRVPARQPSQVNGARLNSWLTRFDAVGRTDGGINRVAYSDADRAGRQFALALFREVDLSPRIDAAGNLIARLPGTDRSRPPIIVGSHIDSVTNGGNFDGPVGSFAGIEVARSLREQQVRLRHPLEVVIWANEEGGVIGSKLAVGDHANVNLDDTARSGRTIRDGIALIGGAVSRLADDVRSKGSARCYLELHIEQGGLLEQSSRSIGVVQGIVGLRWLEVTIDGVANHAGTTPMDQRNDAMLAAARFTVAVNETVRSEPGRQVATVGHVVPTPNTRNVIPGRVLLTVDLRDLDPGKLVRFVGAFERLGREIGEATGTAFSFRDTTSSEPALADAEIMDRVEVSATRLGLTSQRMPSGAGHDAQELAKIAPMGMIFVPSVGGISHSPREFTRAEDVTRGANVLFNTVLAMDA